MRHSCMSGANCYLDKHVLKFGVFNECFPLHGMNFTDIDGCVERHGQVLFMEWKVSVNDITRGQEILAEQLSRKPGITWIDVVGSAKDMSCEYYRIWANGVASPWEECTLEFLKARIAQWIERVEQRHGKQQGQGCAGGENVVEFPDNQRVSSA